MTISRRFLSQVYYYIKPSIPRGCQILIRRRIVQWQQQKHSNTWPIHEWAAKPPPGWSGWPNGKRFAFVITHDTDTVRGYEKCIQLASLDEAFGFKSSFNFVAEDYYVSERLREHLINRGFEIGVHGLTHRGNPFYDKKEFMKQAPKINRYLKEWKCVGFRCPSMYHNLEWISELNIQYDSSTFDTDPFEPQPDGMETIFPFWVSDRFSRRGYVELPYTLPQDFTLFILLKERNTRIWQKKIDWIAKMGGMALVNVHPDYMNFSEGKQSIGEYPANYYTEFLEYVKRNYASECWHALPRDIAAFFKGFLVSRSKI